jgi:hypothetical protein
LGNLEVVVKGGHIPLSVLKKNHLAVIKKKCVTIGTAKFTDFKRHSKRSLRNNSQMCHCHKTHSKPNPQQKGEK